MFKYTLRTTEKQRHINRKNLLKRLKSHEGESFVIEGSHGEIVNKFGQILSKEGKHIIVLKGVVYRIIFRDTNATLYTKPYDVDAPVIS